MKIYRLKKIFCIAVFSIGLNATALAAGGIAPAKPYFDGFYAGLGAALGATTPKLSSDSTITVWNGTAKASSTPLAEITGSYDHGNLTKYSGGVPIFAGYGKTFNNWYLGGELGATYFFNSKMHSPVPEAKVSKSQVTTASILLFL